MSLLEAHTDTAFYSLGYDILCRDEGGESLLKEIHSKFLTRPKLHKVVWVELDEISLILKYNHQFYVVTIEISRSFEIYSRLQQWESLAIIDSVPRVRPSLVH